MRSLEEVFDFVNHFVTTHCLGPAVSVPINLAVEELFTNMVKYNSQNPNDVSIAIEKGQGKLTVVLVDTAARPFDITKAGEVNPDQSLKQRSVGGLGIHLVTKMVDKVDYEYANGQSKITLTKVLEA